jgi:hypothetical protein
VRTVTTSGASITPDADPAQNQQNYGNGHTAPAGSITKPEAYGAEVRWDIRLEAGHNYRFQVMVHDGDQNKVGGDAGEACVTFCAGNTCPEGDSPCTKTADCASGDVCASGCCITPPKPPADAGAGGSGGASGSGGAGGTGTGGTGGTCAPGWKTYRLANGAGVCTPPPTNGVCPFGYVLTIQNGEQFCTQVEIM